MDHRSFFPAMALLLLVCLLSNVNGATPLDGGRLIVGPTSSSFSTALETLQKQIGYNFQNVAVLRRAMTHASFSEESNRALSILGARVIDTSTAFRALARDLDISLKELNRKITEMSKVEGVCNTDGLRLGLHKVVRVSSKTNSSSPNVVCGSFRAIFGAVAIDSGKTDDAGSIFWNVHGSEVGEALSL